MRDKYINFMKEQGEPLSTQDFMDEFSKYKIDVLFVLDRLVIEGVVSVDKSGESFMWSLTNE